MATTSDALTGPTLADIVAEANIEADEPFHVVPSGGDTVFTWDYERSRPPLIRLYEKAKAAQWHAADLPWHTEVDQEKTALAEAAMMGGFAAGADLSGTCFGSWTDKEWVAFSIEGQNWMLSQFLHGEQGALICTSKLIETVPWIDAKYYGATQVMDEARHVEVFSRYLDEKLSGHYQVNAHLRALLDDIVADDRWDVTYLGMQVLVEGLALAAFGVIRQLADEPLLRELLRRVMADEARHVAFGVISLSEVYAGLTEAEIEERQRFAFEATIRMRDRFAMQEVWERLGTPVAEATRLVAQMPERAMFQQMLFAKIVPNCAKLGLLDAGDGWLRDRFTELGIIGFEHVGLGDDQLDA
ncbi:MAG: ferritin-like domain-containing protein [Acidimicrobiia bacterium]|nr:ferritin-like domain-containing protein [Acidimicrobiia bacterium]